MASFSPPLNQNILCLDCTKISTDPVILSCGDSFCKACLQKCWTKSPGRDCPFCKQPSTGEYLAPDLSLANICVSYTQQKRSDPDSQGLCSLHSEKLTLFCVNDEKLVCGQCVSLHHKNHSFCSINKAAGPHKEKIQTHLTALKMKLQMFQKVKETSDKEAAHIKAQAKNTEKQIKEEFEMLYQFLSEEEEARIADLRKEEGEKSQRMKMNIKELDSQIKDISARIAETEEKLKDDVRVLQDVHTALQRAQYTSPIPELGSVSLIDVAKHLGNLRFRVWEKMKTICPYFPVVLDPNTANSSLSISTDLSSISKSAENLQLPDNPERLSAYPGVLASEGFSSGTHSWEVEVGDSEKWIVGVAEESIRRKEACVAAPENRFFCIWRSDDVIAAGSTNASGVVVTKAKPIKTIQVTFNWKKGQVIFSSKDTYKTIHKFKHRFTKKAYPYFSNNSPSSESSLKILPFPSRVSIINSSV